MNNTKIVTTIKKSCYRVSLKDVKLSFDVFRKKVRMYDIYQFS